MAEEKKQDEFDILDGLSIKIRNYKCFGDEPQGFDTIKPINVIVGKNNSGKSSLLDAVGFVFGPKAVEVTSGQLAIYEHYHEPLPGEEGKIPIISRCISKEDIDQMRQSIPAQEHRELESVKSQAMTYNLLPEGRWEWDASSLELDNINPFQTGFDIHFKRILKACRDRDILRLSSARNFHKEEPFDKVEPYPSNVPALTIKPAGEGATQVFEYCLNNADGDPQIILRDLHRAVNDILCPDTAIDSFTSRRNHVGEYEVAMIEPMKDSVWISRSGDGLKTILLVLAQMIAIPRLRKRELGEFVLAFEELENSLHPALLRRLLAYIREKAKNEGAIFFLTTHSPVVIDFFARDELAQIVQVTHDGENAAVRTVQNPEDGWNALDDLGVRPSDTLQTNGVIWVEGTSDCVYINRWIELWDEKLQEGVHYQCLHYGGDSLLSMMGETDEERSIWLANMRRLNPNMVFIADSDRKTHAEDIDEHIRWIEENMPDDDRCMMWITAGKEIENYYPKEAIAALTENTSTRSIGPLEGYKGYYTKMFQAGSRKQGIPQAAGKKSFARRITPHLTRADLEQVLDMKERMDELISCIKSWNGM